jgi:DNA-binding transcriptional LysR family regulator
MNTSDLALFVEIADIGSITTAAKQLDISPSAASAALKRLEKHLNIELFIRSTRKLRITLEGERFLVHCRKVLSSLDDAKASINSSQDEIAGRIHLSVSSDLGRNLVLPWLDDVMDEKPKLSFQLSLDDSVSDFYMDKVDVALRYGQLDDSSMVAFHLATTEYVICASPEYINQYTPPQKPEDLVNHNCLLYRLGNQTYDIWEFTKKQNLGLINTPQKIKVHSNRICNDGDVVRRWALAGKGLALKSRFNIINDLKIGNLIELMPDYQAKSISLWLICPSKKQVTPAVLFLRELLREKCKELLK